MCAEEDDGYHRRARLQKLRSLSVVKYKPSVSGGEEPYVCGPVLAVENFTERVWCLQESIFSRFKNYIVHSI